MLRWIVLVLWLGLCFGVAGVSGRWTAAEIPGWYAGLVKPAINPPNWIFAPVWTTLYAMMAVAAWRITLEPATPLRTAAIALFLAQLTLNFAWSSLFFHQHAIGWAFVEIVALWVLIGLTTVTFARVDSTAAWLMTPYWAWVSFASLLNYLLWQLNHQQ